MAVNDDLFRSVVEPRFLDRELLKGHKENPLDFLVALELLEVLVIGFNV
jgi:hypothetical protein